MGLRPDINRVPQRLYDSEINFSVSCFWDGGFAVKIGDGMNGFKASAEVTTWYDVLNWLDREARKFYPQSQYVTGKYPDGWRKDNGPSARG